MTKQEWAAPIVEELIEGVDKGDFSGYTSVPEKYTYKHLIALFYLAEYIDGGIEFYREIYKFFIGYGKYKIREKLKNGMKLKIAFQTISAAEWPAQKLYEKLSKLEEVETYIVVCPLHNRSVESMEYTYETTYRFFEENGYKVKGTYDIHNKCTNGWEKIGGMPDVIIHLTSWYNAVPKEYWLDNIPLSTLNCYIPYGIYVVDSPDGNCSKQYAYNKEFMNLMWKIYADTEQSLLGYQKYQLLQGENVKYFGYSKMDYFYEMPVFTDTRIREIWKIPKDLESNGMKKVIIAPHHTIKESAGLLFSTFAQNMYFWLYLVEKYKDRISFIFKPHPNLRARAVEAHLFANEKECAEYIARWNCMSNAKVVEEADYLDVFATSDGMIMDSCSFVAEYMYAQKPLLFLTREGQGFTPLGARIMEGYYKTAGNNYSEIEAYLEEVILAEQDDLKQVRRRIWEEKLDYLSAIGKLANDSIFEDLVDELLVDAL